MGKRGRPPKAPDETHEVVVSFRAGAAEAVEFHEAAIRSGVSLSTWLRRACMAAVYRDNPPPPVLDEPTYTRRKPGNL